MSSVNEIDEARAKELSIILGMIDEVTYKCSLPRKGEEDKGTPLVDPVPILNALTARIDRRLRIIQGPGTVFKTEVHNGND